MRKVSSHKDCRKHLGTGGMDTQLCLYQEQEVDRQAFFRYTAQCILHGYAGIINEELCVFKNDQSNSF